MEILTGSYKAENGKDYYNIALNLGTGEYIQIKNASCTAVAEDMALKYFNTENCPYTSTMIKVFFQGTSPELNVSMIPKKYHRYFQEA
ncbi:MAG: hypothetical protein IKS48_00190 [Eubacterium sp.]|nr:hypothetical protein [Eubacterium sp.]